MRFSYTEDQLLVADSTRRSFERQFDRASVHRFTREQEIMPAWRDALGELGVLGICAGTEGGGSGLGAIDALPVAIEAGRWLAPYPVADSIAAASILATSQPALAEAVIAARTIVAFGAGAGLTATSQHDAYAVSGRLGGVSWGLQASHLLAEVSFGDGDLRLVLIDLGAPGIERTRRDSTDPTCPAAGIRLDACAVTHESIIGPAAPLLPRLRAVLAAGELLGAAEACLTLSVDYMKQRTQFGQEIGRFQALKHIAATNSLQLESMRVAAQYAAWAHDTNADDADEACDIAKHYSSEAGRRVAEDAIQCHGGIGFTWEYGLHFFLRRILKLGAVLGTSIERREAMVARLLASYLA